jgi:hypothetical protein
MIILGMADEVLTAGTGDGEQAVRKDRSRKRKSLRIWNFAIDGHLAATDFLLNGLLELLEGCHP